MDQSVLLLRMQSIVDLKLKSFKTDFTKHDIKFIKERPNKPFIWALRSSGTNIAFKGELLGKEWIKTAKKHEIEATINEAGLAIWYKGLGNDVFYHFDGENFIQINKKRAKSILRSWALVESMPYMK